jgi:hypothetical protein
MKHAVTAIRPYSHTAIRLKIPVITGLALLIAAACSSSTAADPNADHLLALGTWGGDTGGFIVSDTTAHLHIGCTFGDVKGRIAINEQGNFAVTGSYMLKAYPIQVGPTMPATIFGHVDRNVVVVSAMVSDTVEKKVVTRGPVTLTFDTDPRLGPCPICKRPDEKPKSWLRRFLHL